MSFGKSPTSAGVLLLTLVVYSAAVCEKTAFAAPSADTSDIFVAPMLGANWGQGSPMNDLTPRRSPCGCAATAGGQELRLWRWPYRFEKSRTFAHQYLDDDGNWTTYTIRLDGRVPLDWDKIAASGGASTPVASDKETAYNTAMLTAWLQSFAKISFKPGAGSANQKICSEAENWWYEAGPVMSRHRNGYDNLWTAIANDLAFGSPVQINTPVHQMVIDGYAVDNAGTANETRWINTNYGWGGAICWENFDTVTTSGGSAGVFADFQTGYRPQKRVQFESVPRVSEADVPLVWHLAPCYTNKIDGFTLEIAKFAGETQFTDDFANSTGVASGEKFKVENGVLGGYPAIQTSYFTYPETYMATAGSVLEFDVQSRYMSGHAATAEICADGGAWETVATIPLSAGKNAAFGTPTHQTVSLAAFAGRTVRLRFKLACTWAGYTAGSSPDFIIDNVSLSGVTGFEETETVEIERDDSTPGIYGYTASGLEDGANYAFTVTPVMTDGSAARSNAATTRIGTPEPAPEILGVSSVACGLELVQDGFFIECARDIVNDIDVDCNAATVDLVALPSHLSILPDEKISVEGENGIFTVHVDATEMAETGKFHDGDMLILTLVATNADGTEAAKNLMLRFNSMRQVMDGTFDVVDSDAATPVWFCGNTTIDAKGQAVVFAAGAFQGTGNVTLVDSIGGGSFAFDSLDGFTGTLAFGDGVSVALPADMTAFAGKISSDVTLESGETMKIAGMTPFTGGITLAGGTLKIALSDEDVAYGFSTSDISYIAGSVVFVAPDGTETAATQTGSTFSIAGTANVWTGTDAWVGDKYSNTSAWSGKALPSAGDYVVFNDASTDGYGALMSLNLASALELAYVRVTGNSYFEIDTFSSDTTEPLSVGVFENTIPVKLNKEYLVPSVVIPRATLTIANGMKLGCDIDHTLAQNLKTRNYTASGEYNAIQYGHAWNGTVVFENYTAAGLSPGEYGNEQSTVRFNGVTGYLAYKDVDPAIELVDNGHTPALHWNDGSSSKTATFKVLKGTGTFKTSKSSVTDNVLIKDVSAFAGSFNLAAKAVAIADSMPTENLAYTGRLLVGKAATIASGATWTANGGVYLGACELTVAGTLASPLTASAAGARLMLADGGTIVASQAIAGDTVPSLDFKAGTYKIDADVRETNTVNFCAAEGDVTTLDANGHKMTLAASFFSGSGDITLVSSVSGGSFVIEGVSQDFTGTIRLDGEVNVSLPDDLSSIGGTIAISGASLAYSSAKLGPLSVGVGSTLTVSLTDSEAMKGFSASSVTLDGGTIEFVDQYGTIVGSSTESTTYVKPDGYTLAPVPTAVWVSGEFEDEAALHGGYAIALNDNTVNDSGNIVIGSATTLGATIDTASGDFTNATVLVKYTIPSGGAPVDYAVPAGFFNTKDFGALASKGSSDLRGYWLDGSTLRPDGFAFSSPAPSMPESGYLLISTWAIKPNPADHGTALYAGETLESLSGGEKTGLRFTDTNNRVTKIAIGGPTTAKAVPWSGMVIEAVAVFGNCWLAPSDVALYEFPVAKAVVPSWAVASITLQDGNVKYYRDITVAFYEILNGDIDADTVQVLDGSSVDYLGLGFEYDAATQTYSKIKTVIAKIDNGIILLEYTTLAEACEEADLQNIGVVELLAARDSISEAIPSGWSYVSPADSGTEYGTILKTISEIPGTVSNIELMQENVSASADGEWAEVFTKPIYITLGSATNAFTLSFDADIPDGVYGTLLSWDSVLGTTILDSRVVITNDAAKQVIWRKGDGSLSTVGYTTSELIQSGEHYIELNWVNNSGATIKVDGETYYASGSLKFTDYLTSRLALGGSALGSPDDVLAGLKVKNLNFRVGKQPTEPDEENENFPRLGYVTRLDGTVYHDNDANRAVITNWQTQITGVAKRPVPEGKADADFKTIDLLFVYDTPGKEYVESNESTWNGASALEVYSAKATAKMNQILCTTDMDTNFWFRMVGVHTVDGTGGTLKEILGKCEGLTGEYKHMLELRDRYGADVIVCPSPNGGGIGGLARLNTLDEIKSRGQNAAYHFATVLLNYSQTHAWVHEIGHNMSLNHYPPANFDPANTWRGLGFQHKIAVDGTSMSSVMAEQGYADFCGGFSSKNHIYHGSRLSISNHLDSTGVLLEAAPYVSQWRSTRIPETQEIKCSVTSGSYLTGDTAFELSYPDPDAEIHYMVWGENNNEYQTYNGPFTVTADGKTYAYINAYVITNGAQSATVNVAFNPFNSELDTLLGSPKLPWTTAASIDGGWVAASGEEYLEVADGFTEKRTAESTLSTTVVGPDTLSFQHSELLKDNPYRGSWPHTFADSSFTVWVDNEPVYMLRGATNTLENWTTTEIAIPEGTHKVDFTYSHRSGYVSGETVRIKSVALASAQEPEDPPVDPDSYAIEPLAVWYKDFKTAEKGGYTLSTSGTTAIADDTYGSTLTIGDAAAVIDVSAANTNELTVLVKYTAAPGVTSAPVVAFGGMAGKDATVGLDVGAYTKADKTLAVYRNFSTDNGKPYEFASAPVLSATGGYLLCARDNVQGFRAYVGESLDSMTGETLSNANIKYSNVPLTKIGIGGGSTLPANANDMVPFTGFVVEKIAVFKGYYTPRDLIPIENPEDAATLSIADNVTWNFAAGATRTYENIGALSSSGTIAITNDTVAAGVYKLAEWTTPQQYTTVCAGYGRVGTLSVSGLANGLVAELVYGVNAIYLRVYDETTQFLKPTLSIMPYGDSITEGFNAQHTGANYRILLYQKLRMLGYNVKSCGVYGLDDGYDSVDPSGEPLSEVDRWHSAKHGAVAGRSTVTASGRSDLEENVDTLAAAAGKPDFVLLHIGINDLVSSDRNPTTVCQSVTNIAWRLVNDLPDTKIVLSTVLNVTGSQKDRTFNDVALPDLVAQFNDLLAERIADFPEGRVYLADLNGYVKSDDLGVIYSDGIHPDWRGFDQMAEGWLSVITNVYSTASGPFPSNEYADYVDDSALGAAAKTELADYIDGFTLAQTIDVASTNAPTVVSGEGVTENIGKVGYFVEYVRADNETHKWVWVDMDAPATTLEDLGLPTANRQQVVTSLHVKSNHNGIDDIAPDDDSATGFIEFSPYKGTGAASSVSGAPAAYGSAYGWNDTLGTSGDYGCMQIHRVVSTSSAPGGQVLFAYNNWKASDSAAEFGIGNFSQHFHAGTQTFDYMDTRNLGKMNATAYRVKRIEIWTKEAPSCNATVVRVHPRLTRGLAREALLGIRFDNALGGNASAFDVHFRLVNCTKADITDIKYWRQPYTHNYGFYEAEATQGPAATVSAADDAKEFTASFPAGSVWFYPQVGTREDSDYLWVTATINPEISPDAEIWVSVPTEKIMLANGGVFDVVNGAETQPHRVFPFVHQIGAYLRQDGTALTGTWAGKLEDSPANRVGNLTDIVVCNDFLVAYDSENDTFKTTWDARGRDNTAQVARIKALRDLYNPKCMIRGSLTKGSDTITVDGVTGRPIACAAASAARRKQLIDSILAVMESAGLDGLDIDWEYPGDHAVSTANTQRDWHAYGLLMRDLAAAFFDKGYVLSFCSNLGYQMAPSGYYAAFHAADFVNAMAYGNTTLNASPQVMMTGINVCTSRGVPPRRIVVGQAMYAYEVQNPGWGSVVGWLKEAWPNDKTRWWDADLVWKSRSVTKPDSTVISTEKETFEGPSSYHAKCNWCRANGYGGVMSWGYFTDVSWDDADLMSLSRHQAKSCWPRTNWSWPTPPQDTDGAYLLDSEEDWFWLRDNPGVNARFAADIALTHDPLPIETFSGTIDGAGHTLTISNDVWLAYDSNPALVRTLTGTVKNLTIDLYGRVVSRASRWKDTTASKTANTLASGTHNAAVLAANLGAGGVIDGVELFIRPGAEVQGPQRVAGLAASVWVGSGSHAEIRNSSVHVEGVVRSLARNTAEGDITVQNQCAGGLAGWVGCPGARNIVVTNNIVSLASTGRVAVETGSSSSAGGVIGDLNNVNPLVQSNAVYVESGAAVAANEGAGAGNVRTSYANASYSISSSANAGQTTFFIEDGAAALADSIGGKSDATVEVSSYGDEATDGISVDAVAGFWYSVIYGDELVSGGIGGVTGETAPVKAEASGPLTLDAPKGGVKRFYRVKVVPVKAAPVAE